MEKVSPGTYKFIERAKEVHGDLYDYSKVVYKNAKTKIIIIDPIYGEFLQSPDTHLRGQNHPTRGRLKRNNTVRKTTEEFIKRAKEVHGDLYDYSKVDYIGSHDKVCIIDPIYGEFYQDPISHLKGHGSQKRNAKCKSDSMTNDVSFFIKRAKEVHGDLYDYSKVDYIGSHDKVCIIDPIYGEFYQTPSSHMSGRGNPYRAGRGEITTSIFIERALKIHGNLYDYSKVVYINSQTPVLIIDPIYGEFEQKPSNHLIGKGNILRAAKIRGEKLKISFESLIERFNHKHNNFYDYSKVEYINIDTNIIIIDPEYGEFYQTPYSHLNGSGHPSRTGKNYKFNYISGIFDNNTIIGLKYGVESTKENRTKQQNINSKYDIIRIQTWESIDHYSCKKAEDVCKSIFQEENKNNNSSRGIVTYEEMNDGWSETTTVQNLEKIIEIYKEHGAVLINDNDIAA